jgi:RNA polymerase sigma factor (sigma-70 family)
MNINKLIEENLFLAKKIASDRKKSVPKFVDFEELQSAAYLGLVEAANRFDENRGIAFSTFAYPRIFGAVLDYLRQNCKFEKTTSETEMVQAKSKNVDENDLFEHIFKEFNKYDRDILRSYYIVGNSMKEIGQEYGLSESRISQLISKNKNKILNKWKYEDFAFYLGA